MPNEEKMTKPKISKLQWKFILVAIGAVNTATFAMADQKGKAEGTLMLDKKTYTLKQALAYETTIDNEDAIAVVLSGPAISSEQLKEARKTEKDGGDPNFKRPFLRLVFKKTGELKHYSAAAGGTMLGRRSGAATGELKIDGGHVTGNAKATINAEDMIPVSFDVRFETSLMKANESLPESTAKKGGPPANVPPTVTGIFKGNGKEAKLAHVSAHWREPFSGKTGMVLVFTEKDHSKEKKPDTAAMFGKFGSALIISIHDEDGRIYGCQVVHSAHQKQGFSSIGNIEATEFTYADGKVEGAITTNGQVETFGETWEVNIKFVAPLGEIPKEFQVAKKPETKKEKEKAITDAEDDDSPTATSVVEQLVFKSGSDVKKVCAELTANLKAQGWANDGPDTVMIRYQ